MIGKRRVPHRSALLAVAVVMLSGCSPQPTSAQTPGVDQEFADALWAARMAAQSELPAKFGQAVHITATRSNHYIQYGNPQLIDSIRDIVDVVR